MFTTSSSSTSGYPSSSSLSTSNSSCLIQPALIRCPTPASHRQAAADERGNVIQVSLHSASKAVIREFEHIFGGIERIGEGLRIASSSSSSDAPPSASSTNIDGLGAAAAATASDPYLLFVIPTIQPSTAGSLTSIGPQIESEKDRLLETFYAFSQSLLTSSTASSLWLDYIDPCSGLPSIRTDLTRIYDEVSSFQSLLSYSINQASGCKVMEHPVYGGACYPATVFVVGRRSEVLRVYGEMVREGAL
jgi:hypothetical protein